MQSGVCWRYFRREVGSGKAREMRRGSEGEVKDAEREAMEAGNEIYC